jgi:hypothetical protein
MVTNTQEVNPMEGPIIAIVALLVSSFGFAVASLGWGADSRPTMADDHQR